MFRIWLYLSFLNFLSNLFSKNNLDKNQELIKKTLSHQSSKNLTALFSQCRVGFYFILKYIKKKSKKNEIIFCAYNLPEMVNIAVNLNFKIKFCDINYKTGTIDLKQLKKKITNKTSAIVLNNMFNNYQDSKKIKKITKKFKINLIEDNAIYFDNYFNANKKKYYSGIFGDFTLYSFNIMKNISSLYGGAVSTNEKNFINYCQKEDSKMSQFNLGVLLKQILIFMILKLMSLRFLYRYFFVYIIRYVHKNNIKSILQLFYTSLKSERVKFPKYYFS